MRVKLIYTTSSSGYGIVIFFRIMSMVAFYMLLREYDEEPGLILLLLILDVIFFLSIGYEKIIICEDRMISKNMSFYDRIFNSKGTTYLFNDIREAKLPQPNPVGDVIRVVRSVGLLNLFYLRRITKAKHWISFSLEMKDGKSIPIFTELEEEEISKIVEIINGLIMEKSWKPS